MYLADCVFYGIIIFEENFLIVGRRYQIMKIVTFNTQHCKNFIEQRIDFDIMAQTIKLFDPDIVALNEMRGEGTALEHDDQVGILAKLTGISNSYFAKASGEFGVNPYGNGLLTKYKIVSVETVMIPDPAEKTGSRYYETRCILKANLENGVTVLVAHFGLNKDEQENAVATVIANLAPEKCILMGDFNVTPDNEVLLPIRERMKDTAENFCADKLSFPSDRPEIKIDYIFVSPDVRVISADIPDIIASDHRVHIAEIDI